MDARDWPAGVPIAASALFVETLTALFPAQLTRQTQRLARAGDRWAAELSLDLTDGAAARADAFLAALRGPAGTVLVPDHHRPHARGTLASFEAYAATVGRTWFDDTTGWDDGTGFHEGSGVPRVRGGYRHQIVLDGCWPLAADLFATDDAVQTGPGQAVLITDGTGVTADFQGFVVYPCAPRLREPVTRGPAVTSAVVVAMRLAAMRVRTEPPCRTVYQLRLVEAVARS